MKTDLQEKNDTFFINNYLRYPVSIVRGDGTTLFAEDGSEYLDFLSGIAVCALGHCHPRVTEAICKQAGALVHVSNLYYTKPQTELAELLVENSFGDKVFMCNSGAEANEAAIKLARIYSPEGKYKVISLQGSFHGRTLAAVAATGQPKFHQGFEPIPEGFAHAPFGDLEALEGMIDDSTCAIMCEPIQGESGVRPLGDDYLKGIRELCNKHDLLLIYDEVQTGMGRTGKLFAYEHSGVVPDIMTLAKALGNGLPIGAMVTTKEIGAALVPGTHASTFGGNPVAAAAGVATMNTILENDFLNNVEQNGVFFQKQLAALIPQFPELFTGVRGGGMLQAIVLSEKGVELGAEIVNIMFEQKILINFAGNAALRFAPPLIVTRDEIERVVATLGEVVNGILS